MRPLLQACVQLSSAGYVFVAHDAWTLKRLLHQRRECCKCSHRRGKQVYACLADTRLTCGRCSPELVPLAVKSAAEMSSSACTTPTLFARRLRRSFRLRAPAQGVLPGVRLPHPAVPVPGQRGVGARQRALVRRQHHAAHARGAQPARSVGGHLDAALSRCISMPRQTGFELKPAFNPNPPHPVGRHLDAALSGCDPSLDPCPNHDVYETMTLTVMRTCALMRQHW